MNKCVIIVTHSNELAEQADVILRLKKASCSKCENGMDNLFYVQAFEKRFVQEQNDKIKRKTTKKA